VALCAGWIGNWPGREWPGRNELLNGPARTLPAGCGPSCVVRSGVVVIGERIANPPQRIIWRQVAVERQPAHSADRAQQLGDAHGEARMVEGTVGRVIVPARPRGRVACRVGSRAGAATAPCAAAPPRRRIDFAVAAVMAFAVASTSEPGPQMWVFDGTA
jgi:hypothetical protein